MKTPNRLVGVLLVTGVACRANPAAKPGEEKLTSDSVAATPTELSMTMAQVQHGGIAWTAVGAGGPGTVGEAAALPGQLVPDEDRTARFGSPAEGRVLGVMVSPGDRVETGTVLVTLQSPAAAAAQADLGKARAALASHRAHVAYARSALQRAERLLALKAIPRQDYERAIADDELARSELASAEAEQQRAEATVVSLGAEATPNGELALRARRPGVVLERQAVPGAVVAAGAPLVVVTDPTRLWLTMAAPEALSTGLHKGASVRFVVPALPADTFAAPLDAVAAGLDPMTRTLTARATVDNPKLRLKPAMLATVLLPIQAPPGGLVSLPDDAVQLLDGKEVVFLAVPDSQGGAHLMVRAVRVGARSGGRAHIVAGLRAGELVVTRGAFAVRAALRKGSMPDMEM